MKKVFPPILVALMALSSLAQAAPNAVDSQREVAKKYPDIAVAGSPLNLKFVEAVKKARAENDAVLQSADWPMQIAQRVAEPATPPAEAAPVAAPAPRTPRPSVGSQLIRPTQEKPNFPNSTQVFIAPGQEISKDSPKMGKFETVTIAKFLSNPTSYSGMMVEITGITKVETKVAPSGITEVKFYDDSGRWGWGWLPLKDSVQKAEKSTTFFGGFIYMGKTSANEPGPKVVILGNAPTGEFKMGEPVPMWK